MIDNYFRLLLEVISESPAVRSSSVSFDRRSNEIGFIRGELIFLDNSKLHFREFVRQPQDSSIERYMYVYQYQRAERSMVFRYDNSPHFPSLVDFPHHKHIQTESEVIPVSPPDLFFVLEEIESLVHNK